jgi:hypothetical protein
MSIVALEGVVKQGQIRLKNYIQLPESATVYVVIPGEPVEPARIYSPHLADSTLAQDFKMAVSEEWSEASV